MGIGFFKLWNDLDVQPNIDTDYIKYKIGTNIWDGYVPARLRETPGALTHPLHTAPDSFCFPLPLLE